MTYQDVLMDTRDSTLLSAKHKVFILLLFFLAVAGGVFGACCLLSSSSRAVAGEKDVGGEKRAWEGEGKEKERSMYAPPHNATSLQHRKEGSGNGTLAGRGYPAIRTDANGGPGHFPKISTEFGPSRAGKDKDKDKDKDKAIPQTFPYIHLL